MGIHGEPGVRRGKLEKADQIVDSPARRDPGRGCPSAPATRVAIPGSNGLGATPKEELYIM